MKVVIDTVQIMEDLLNEDEFYSEVNLTETQSEQITNICDNIEINFHESYNDIYEFVCKKVNIYLISIGYVRDFNSECFVLNKE